MEDPVCSDCMYPSAIAKHTEIDTAVTEVVGLLAPDVVRIRSEIGQDWSGDWAIALPGHPVG
jgi:hypothetical protein